MGHQRRADGEETGEELLFSRLELDPLEGIDGKAVGDDIIDHKEPPEADTDDAGGINPVDGEDEIPPQDLELNVSATIT